MNKFIFIALAIGLLVSPAKADSLPKDYIGVWCDDSKDGKDINALARENDKCLDNETTITIHAKGYDSSEDDECKFVSIQRTGEYTLIPLTKTKYFKIPHIRTVARCSGESISWMETRVFYLGQGGVMFGKLLKR